MNAMHTPDAGLRLTSLLARQRARALRDPNPNVTARKVDLRDLKRQVKRYQDALAEAVSQDFGHRPEAETKLLDLFCTTLEINHLLDHVDDWIKPQPRTTELFFRTNSLALTYQPKGVVGIIVPWNFPVYLALAPLAVARAAGNRVMLKLSELTPRTNRLLKQLLSEIFSEDEVAVFGEELTDPTLFSRQPFDHLIFTGSPAVGRHVMAAAAQNLTPVTLELGGKSPAVVLADYDIADAARRIVHGKVANAGQACVAPDYALIPRVRVADFVAAARQAYRQMLPDGGGGNRDYATIISDRHHQRLQDLLTDARARGATVMACGDAVNGQLPLHIVSEVTPDMRIMQEEIFGPLLPVATYDSLDDAIALIQAGTRPLALYCFSHDKPQRDRLLAHTHSGGVTINDWGWHVMNHDVPFGGTGTSGMGSYHGIEGFRELSHARPVFKRHRFFPTQLFHPPYDTLLQRLTLRVVLGKSDPDVTVDR